MSAVPTCFQSVTLYLTPGMITLVAGLRGGCGCWTYRVDEASQPPTTQLSDHTSQHLAILGTQAHVFYETLGRASFNSVQDQWSLIKKLALLSLKNLKIHDWFEVFRSLINLLGISVGFLFAVTWSWVVQQRVAGNSESKLNLNLTVTIIKTNGWRDGCRDAEEQEQQLGLSR